MKKLYMLSLIVIPLLLGGARGGCQAPNVLWAKSAGGTSSDYGLSCATDASGNVFVTGSFWNTSITFGTTTLTNAGSSDMFIVKYDSNGNVLWAKSAGGTSTDFGNSCATDVSGNVFVTGSFGSSSITFGTTTLTNAGGVDIFIVKYDANGNNLWAKNEGGTSTDYGNSCATDASGNVFVTGYFESPSITFGTTTLTNAGNDDMFVVKYDDNGNVLWAKSGGGTSSEYVLGCATDASGNVFVTGYFESPSITFGTTTLTNAGNDDMFVVKYDDNGNVLWAKSAGGNSNEVGFSCATDASGNVFVTGSFAGPSIIFGTTTLINADNTGNTDDVFIVKYDANGNNLWAKSAGGNSNEVGSSCATDASGNVFVTGFFGSSSITFGTTTLTNAGGVDIFIVKYDANGNNLWAKNAGGNSNEVGFSCATDASGNVFVTGRFASDSITFGTTILTNAGVADMFIVKLDGGTTSINEDNFENGITVFPNPTSGEFQIQPASGTWYLARSQKQFASIEIYTVYGEKVYSATLDMKQETWNCDLRLQPSGIYFLTLKSDSETAPKESIRTTKKIIIHPVK